MALSLASQVYDQDSHSEADLAFLAAYERATQEWLDTLNHAKKQWNGDIEAFEAVKALATRQRDRAYADAEAVYRGGRRNRVRRGGRIMRDRIDVKEAFEAVKALATRQRDRAYADAEAVYRAGDEIEFAEAAE